jgi:hypothetical protein
MQKSATQQPDNVSVTFRKAKFDFDSVTDQYWMRKHLCKKGTEFNCKK